MGHPKNSFRSKAAHLVSDFTTSILNPISDESSTPRGDQNESRDEENLYAENEPRAPDGPDTSSFTAFLMSLLSSSESVSHSDDESNGCTRDKDTSSISTMRSNSVRKSLFARGKQSLGKVINRATRMTGYKYNRIERKEDGSIRNDPNLLEQELVPMKSVQEAASQFDLPDISEPSLLLSDSLRSAIYMSFPIQIKGRNWVLLYSTWRHGISLSTLYRRSMLCPGHCLLVVGDQKGAVFGGLVEAPLQPSSKKKYQGSNSTFVFTNLPSCPIISRPTGANRYFTLCSPDFLALGGGGHFALYLDGDLLNGSSYASETFGNSCLAHTEDFTVKEVELWAFVYASKYKEMMELCCTEAPGICRVHMECRRVDGVLAAVLDFRLHVPFISFSLIGLLVCIYKFSVFP